MAEKGMPEEVQPGIDWYDCIERGIRETVKLLRNNGFNTTCSCHHSMTVEMEWYVDDEITTLFNLLMDNGYSDFLIEGVWGTGEHYGDDRAPQRYIALYFGRHGAEAFADNQRQRE